MKELARRPIDIPIRAFGPGSQPDEAPLDMLAMPSGMSTFQMPRVPEQADPRALAAARDVIAELVRRMDAAQGAPLRLDVAAVAPAALGIVNQMLGDGEVSIRLDGAGAIHVQESVFAGVWRVQQLDDGALVADAIEVCSVPPAVVERARAAADGMRPVELPAGVMNAPSLLAEIAAAAKRYRPGQAAHVVNLTLLPLSPADHVALEHALPVGPVAVMSRGFGNCRITSTSGPNVWRVQYFNNMQTLILNTIEIVDVPEVATAAADDLADSRERLAELLDWMTADCAALSGAA